MVKSGLEFILKSTEPLQRYLLSCQANSAILGWYFCTGQQQLWRGSVNFKIKSLDHLLLFTIIFKWKNGNFKTLDFSPLTKSVLAGVRNKGPIWHCAFAFRKTMNCSPYLLGVLIKLYYHEIYVCMEYSKICKNNWFSEWWIVTTAYKTNSSFAIIGGTQQSYKILRNIKKGSGYDARFATDAYAVCIDCVCWCSCMYGIGSKFVLLF